MQQDGGMSEEKRTDSSIFHRVELERFGFSKNVMIAGLVVAVLGGLFVGYVLGGKPGMDSSKSKSAMGEGLGAKQGVKSAGSKDKKAFPDCAKGQLEKGGLSGEGTHHLVREGGPSQTAYLLSSVVDLDQFSGKMVELCGKSIASRKVAWLMDVGYVGLVE